MANDYLFETLEEYNTEITNVQSAISRIILTGAENKNESGGSSREIKDTPLQTLIKYKKQLIAEKTAKFGCTSALFLEPGW